MDIQAAGKGGRGAKKNPGSQKDSGVTGEQRGTGCRDKRADHRHTLELDTEVHFQEQYLDGMFRCRTSNIGVHGVFLFAEDLPITQQTKVELVFFARTRPVPKHYRVCAKVVRVEDNGAALVFCPKNEKQVQNFRHFLLKAKIAARKI